MLNYQRVCRFCSFAPWILAASGNVMKIKASQKAFAAILKDSGCGNGKMVI
jgi:hypothetical protein